MTHSKHMRSGPVLVLLTLLVVGCGDAGESPDRDLHAGAPGTHEATVGTQAAADAVSGVWERFGVTERERWANQRILIYSPDAEIDTEENQVTMRFPNRFSTTWSWDVPPLVLHPGDPLPVLRVRSEVYAGAPGQPDDGIRAQVTRLERSKPTSAHIAEVNVQRPGPGVYEKQGGQYVSFMVASEGEVLSAVPDGTANQTLHIRFSASGTNAFQVTYMYGWQE